MFLGRLRWKRYRQARAALALHVWAHEVFLKNRRAQLDQKTSLTYDSSSGTSTVSQGVLKFRYGRRVFGSNRPERSGGLASALSPRNGHAGADRGISTSSRKAIRLAGWYRCEQKGGAPPH